MVCFILFRKEAYHRLLRKSDLRVWFLELALRTKQLSSTRVKKLVSENGVFYCFPFFVMSLGAFGKMGPLAQTLLYKLFVNPLLEKHIRDYIKLKF